MTFKMERYKLVTKSQMVESLVWNRNYTMLKALLTEASDTVVSVALATLPLGLKSASCTSLPP